jgi:formylglycine-generating enzyme required for sulfatase activity
MTVSCLVLAGCGGDDPAGGTGTTGGKTPGELATFSAGGVTFRLGFVPGGKTFPIALSDDETATVTNGYWIGETEVSFALWSAVCEWATNAARGADAYHFQNPGVKGKDGDAGFSNAHPVTTVSWRDAMVFCNALTEWYAAQSGAALSPAYLDGGAVVRDARDANAAVCDALAASANAGGFRLPLSCEWELAARWSGAAALNLVSGFSDPYCATGDSLSGAAAEYGDETANDAVAWYTLNSGATTHEVKGKAPNALGLYDMSGNIWEWCADRHPVTSSFKVARGGAYGLVAGLLRIGLVSGNTPDDAYLNKGFRLARADPFSRLLKKLPKHPFSKGKCAQDPSVRI